MKIEILISFLFNRSFVLSLTASSTLKNANRNKIRSSHFSNLKYYCISAPPATLFLANFISFKNIYFYCHFAGGPHVAPLPFSRHLCRIRTLPLYDLQLFCFMISLIFLWQVMKHVCRVKSVKLTRMSRGHVYGGTENTWAFGLTYLLVSQNMFFLDVNYRT